MPEGQIDPKMMETISKSTTVIEEQGDKIQNPLERFNLNLDGNNPQVTFEQVPDSLQEPPLTEKLMEELKRSVKMVDRQTGQTINTLQLNRDKLAGENKAATLFIPPINNAIGAPQNEGDRYETHYRIQELAQYMPDTALIAMDYPGVGESDSMSRDQKRAFSEGKGFEDVARQQLRILQSMGITELNVVGQSLGAFTGVCVAELAHEYGIKVPNLVATETPGVLDTSTYDMFVNRFLSEGKYLELYQSTPLDPDMIKAGGLLQSVLKRKLQDAVWLAKGIVKGKGLRYGKEVSKQNLKKHLEGTFKNNPETKVTMVNGSISNVAPNDETNALVDDMRASGFGNRLRRVVFPGAPHVVMENAKRYAWFTKQALSRPITPPVTK